MDRFGNMKMREIGEQKFKKKLHMLISSFYPFYCFPEVKRQAAKESKTASGWSKGPSRVLPALGKCKIRTQTSAALEHDIRFYFGDRNLLIGLI